MSFNIAIDGPAGAGKSSIAKLVAKEMSFVYVDTGAMYRTIALFFLRGGISLDDQDTISKQVGEIAVRLSYEDGQQQIYLNDENVSTEIRKEEVGNGASKVAKIPEVRKKLVDMQREIAKTTDIIMDGRDIGTVVLPKANVKIYLTASSKERANRRYLELKDKGVECDLDQIEKDIIARDNQDMNREISPLKQADDAVLVDSSHMTIPEVVSAIIKIAKERE